MSEPARPPVPSLIPPPGDLLRAQRKAGRSAILSLMLVWVAALISPLLAYQEDVQNAEEELISRLSDTAGLQAQALGAHLELLRGELQRLARHPELTPSDGASREEVALLESVFSQSRLFSGGVALLSPEGARVWSAPARMPLGESPLASRAWFRRVLEQRTPTIGRLEGGGEGYLVVVVPIVRNDAVVGLLAGELVAASQSLPGARAPHEGMIVLVDESGDVLLPSPAPALLSATTVAETLRTLVQRPGTLTLGETRLLGGAAQVAGSGLLLAVLEDELQDKARLKRRYLGQLFFHTALAAGVLLLFTLLLRRSYHSLLAAEERLRRQETMAALGTASSLIAHEVKNALNGLGAALSLLRPSGPTGELSAKALRSQMQRLGHLASSLLTFASPRAAQYRRCEVRLLVEEAVQAVTLIPEVEAVRLESRLAENLYVKADPALLVSAVDNLVRNAIEAGAVAKDTGQQPDPYVKVQLAEEGEEAVLVVEDNAGGVPPAFEPRLWEPFAVGRAKGIGLGLPMVSAAVEAHRGTVKYTRVPGGSRFTVRLPLERSAP